MLMSHMRPADHSVAHHMLGSYQRSLLAIILAQFTKKRFSGGMAGVVRLATNSLPVQVPNFPLCISVVIGLPWQLRLDRFWHLLYPLCAMGGR